MEYQEPVGKPADAAYEDGNRSAGIKGDIPPGAAIEHPMRELVHLISYSGQTPAASDLEQVRKAIQALIDAAIGGGGPNTYLTMAQARSRLLFFPETQTADGKVNVSSPGAGTILVPSAVTMLHRGCFPMSTSDVDEEDRTFATEANKTYHLRADMTGDELAFALEDVSDAGYNPTLLNEADASFDSGYDDALIARIVTSPLNVATITNLVNLDRLWFWGANSLATTQPSTNASRAEFTFGLNWARTPKTADFVTTLKSWTDGSPDHDTVLFAAYPSSGSFKVPATRYQSKFVLQHDYTTEIGVNFTASA